jgi:uncharacterized membrane protein (UPF0127 family)
MFRIIAKLLKLIIVLTLIGGAGFFLFKYFTDRNQFFNSLGLPNAYSGIEFSVTDLQRKEVFPDVYLLTLGIKNLPSEEGIHRIEVTLWNRTEGPVRFIEARNIVLSDPELSLLFNFPFAITERELFNTDSVQLLMKKDGKTVYVKEADFDPRYALTVSKESYYFRKDSSLLHLRRTNSIEDLTAKLTQTTEIQDNYGYVLFEADEDYVGLYLRRTRLPYDIIFLDSTFRVVDLRRSVPATIDTDTSPYIESKTKSRIVLITAAGWIDTHKVRENDLFVHY